LSNARGDTIEKLAKVEQGTIIEYSAFNPDFKTPTKTANSVRRQSWRILTNKNTQNLITEPQYIL
jgi:hypothetical protein